MFSLLLLLLLLGGDGVVSLLTAFDAVKLMKNSPLKSILRCCRGRMLAPANLQAPVQTVDGFDELEVRRKK